MIMKLHIDWFAPNLAFNHSPSNSTFGKTQIIARYRSGGDVFFDEVQVTKYN